MLEALCVGGRLVRSDLTWKVKAMEAGASQLSNEYRNGFNTLKAEVLKLIMGARDNEENDYDGFREYRKTHCPRCGGFPTNNSDDAMRRCPKCDVKWCPCPSSACVREYYALRNIGSRVIDRANHLDIPIPKEKTNER